MAAAWVQGGGSFVDVHAEIDVASDDLAYQLWDGTVELEPLGVVARREVALAHGIRAILVTIACGHAVEFRADENGATATELVAAVDVEDGAVPVATRRAVATGAARTYATPAGLRLRAAARVVEITPGRRRWLTQIATDPALRQRTLAVASAADANDLRIVLWAPQGRVVHAAHVFAREGKMLLTDTAVLP